MRKHPDTLGPDLAATLGLVLFVYWLFLVAAFVQ